MKFTSVASVAVILAVCAVGAFANDWYDDDSHSYYNGGAVSYGSPSYSVGSQSYYGGSYPSYSTGYYGQSKGAAVYPSYSKGAAVYPSYSKGYYGHGQGSVNTVIRQPYPYPVPAAGAGFGAGLAVGNNNGGGLFGGDNICKHMKIVSKCVQFKHPDF